MIARAPIRIPDVSPDPARDETLPPPTLDDLRFRALLPRADWQALPEPVRRRFSKRLCGGCTVIYTGRITTMRRSRLGAALAQALRVVGAPLPLSAETDVPSVISVTEDVATGGQVWTRLYANRHGFPQIIHSAKRFSGPTGLEEYLGLGLTMALRVAREAGTLVFRDAGYAWRLGRLRLALPRCLDPGRLTVRHADLGNGRFAFTLDLVHPVFGELVHQAGLYRDAPEHPLATKDPEALR